MSVNPSEAYETNHRFVDVAVGLVFIFLLVPTGLLVGGFTLADVSAVILIGSLISMGRSFSSALYWGAQHWQGANRLQQGQVLFVFVVLVFGVATAWLLGTGGFSPLAITAMIVFNLGMLGFMICSSMFSLIS